MDGFVIHPNSIDSNAGEFSGIKWVKNILNQQLGSRPSPGNAILFLVLVQEARFVLFQLALTPSNTDAIFEPLNVCKWRFAFRFAKELYVLRGVHGCLGCEVDDLRGLVIWKNKYGLLTKREDVLMSETESRSINTHKRNKDLDRTSLVNKGFIL